MNYDTSPLKKARLLKGWNRANLGRRSGLHPETIARVERGDTARPETIRKIADVLGVSMSDLLTAA